MAERWLLTGGSGQVGLALRRNPPPGVDIVAPGRDVLDLSTLIDQGVLELSEFTAVINCAAYTAVDKAETEPAQAHAVNCEAAGMLGIAAAAAGIPIIHVSTDYVFGEGEGPWREDDPIAPFSVYGKTKAAGEMAVKASRARHAIVRTSWVISADGKNFVKTMLRLGAERDVLQVVADQRGTPTYAGDLASALARITARFVADPEQASGVWHFANAGETTWHGLAEQVFACASQHGLKVPTKVEPITTSEYPAPARRPADSRLDFTKIANDFGISPRPWQEAVAEIVARLAGEGQAR
ncbi:MULTISPECIES: dTDP-4-dehydrorhamnose reductase [unclassified Novosphingobium]|uniref:dTDP-4-dehydrorhamnose reductase n=1 Tax=unclassified Novosphingobium TaxID=2644732 RepID=UPI0025E14815|nr:MULTISPECIES: dTDP-4-dehydrorhamnose reductase [unclassified Novosphingobium]HQV02581.1 dTDP-4-dehydrorhamnose reductase [Novosphingobium sp.]